MSAEEQDFTRKEATEVDDLVTVFQASLKVFVGTLPKDGELTIPYLFLSGFLASETGRGTSQDIVNAVAGKVIWGLLPMMPEHVQKEFKDSDDSKEDKDA